MPTITRAIRVTSCVLALSSIFFIVLPYPFIDTAVMKTSSLDQTYTNTSLGQGTSWHWFGGYHLTPESLLPKNSWPALDNYYDLTYTNAGVVGFGTVSLLFGVGSFLGLSRLAKRKSTRAEDTEPSV